MWSCKFTPSDALESKDFAVIQIHSSSFCKIKKRSYNRIWEPYKHLCQDKRCHNFMKKTWFVTRFKPRAMLEASVYEEALLKQLPRPDQIEKIKTSLPPKISLMKNHPLQKFLRLSDFFCKFKIGASAEYLLKWVCLLAV